MKKLRNAPETIVEETLAGYAMMNKNIIQLVPGTHIVARKAELPAGKVRFLLGNGAGHEPAVIGWVGPGMLDANLVGEVYTAPSADRLVEALEYLDNGGPILLAVQNHAGDVLNANIAYKAARKKGIDVHKVLFYDDVASAPPEMAEERRGMAGMLFYVKIVGAFLEEGGGIEEAVTLFEEVRDATRTFSAGFTQATHPVTGMSIFSATEGQIELGMGVHGEGGGASCVPMPTSKELAKILCDTLLEDMLCAPGQELLLFLNGLGGITFMEMSMLYKDCQEYLQSKEIVVYDGYCNNCLTTQELSGVSLSICRASARMKRLWDSPCQSGIWCKG